MGFILAAIVFTTTITIGGGARMLEAGGGCRSC